MIVNQSRSHRGVLGICQSRPALLSGVSRFKIFLFELGVSFLTPEEENQIRVALQTETDSLRNLPVKIHFGQLRSAPTSLHRCVAQVQTTYSQEQPNRPGFHHENFAVAQAGVSVETLRIWRKQNRVPRYRNIAGRCVRDSTADLTVSVDQPPYEEGQEMEII